MEEYLEEYGFHFNRRLFEFAVSLMKGRDGNRLKPLDKEQVSSFLKSNGIGIRNDVGHDAAYVFNMAKADYYGSSLQNDAQLALFVKDYLDDPDGAESRAFDEFWIKTVALGIPIFWEEML